MFERQFLASRRSNVHQDGMEHVRRFLGAMLGALQDTPGRWDRCVPCRIDAYHCSIWHLAGRSVNLETLLRLEAHWVCYSILYSNFALVVARVCLWYRQCFLGGCFSGSLTPGNQVLQVGGAGHLAVCGILIGTVIPDPG